MYLQTFKIFSLEADQLEKAAFTSFAVNGTLTGIQMFEDEISQTANIAMSQSQVYQWACTMGHIFQVLNIVGNGIYFGIDCYVLWNLYQDNQDWKNGDKSEVMEKRFPEIKSLHDEIDKIILKISNFPPSLDEDE